jgi:magnesium transporter
MKSEPSVIKDNLISDYFALYPQEVADILNDAEPDEILAYLMAQEPEQAKGVLLNLTSDVVSDVIEMMDAEFFVKIFSTLDVYRTAILLSRLTEEEKKTKLALLPKKMKEQVDEILTYPPESAGFLMDTRIITFDEENTADEVLQKIRKFSDRRIYNIYITDDEGRLKGLVPLQIVAVSQPEQQLGQIMSPSMSVHVMAPQEEVVNILRDRKIISLPVVDFDNKVLGIIRYDGLLNAVEHETIDDVQTIFGAGREERALSKVSFAIRKRLPWLEINLATAFLAASIVGIFEETIAQITVLAVFLPVVAGQSGNTGSQALAVTIRGLALREIRISQWLKVARKEVAVGFFNGLVVALTTSVIVYFWASSFGLALVIGSSMVISMLIAGFSGAVIPILLKSLGQDPAQSSSIILTTVTDIAGFLSFLGLATALSSMLGIT